MSASSSRLGLVFLFVCLFHVVVVDAVNNATHKSGDGWSWDCYGNCSSFLEPFDLKDLWAAHMDFPYGDPSLFLVGGGSDPVAGFEWAIDRAGKGNFLVLRSAGTDAYDDWIYDLDHNKLNSVQTLIVNSTSGSTDDFVLGIVMRASFIFFSGGDQYQYCEYYNETGMPGSAAMRMLLNQKGKLVSMGGTSAGLAIQGEFVFTAKYDTVNSSDVLMNPTDKSVDIGTNFLHHKFLRNIITDTHFDVRDRMGRLVGFLANIQFNKMASLPKGMGVDQTVACMVDEQGICTTTSNSGQGAAYFLSTTAFPQSQPGQPLTLASVTTARVMVGGQFDVRNWKAIPGPLVHEYVLYAKDGTLASTGNNGQIY